MNEYGDFLELYWKGKTNVLGERPFLVPISFITNPI
jgi:hypothetical protein